MPPDRQEALQISCLGPVGLTVDGRAVSLGENQSVTLATLAAFGERGASKNRFYSELFDGRPQRSGEQAAVMRVHRLAKKITAAGYAGRMFLPGARVGIDPTACHVDVWRFRDVLTNALVSPSNAGLADALRQWVEPFEDLSDDPPVVRAARDELGSLYRSGLAKLGWALEPRTDDDLLLAMAHQVARHPFDEALVSGVAVGLYRSGRQAQALRLIQQTRGELLQQLGISGGPALDQAEFAILSHDRELLGSGAQAIDPSMGA